jgi:peptidoglycan hydrolase-like protein with peptidoglycan-binding domain
MRKTISLAVAILLVTGFGVSAARAQGAAPPAKKSASAKPGTSTRRGKVRKSSSRKEKGQKAPTADRIKEIQQALTKDGSFSGTPNGKWDETTSEAMRKFQAGHGLNANGKLDAKTLQQLGLGSQTAGVAAPMPPVSSSSAATPSTQTARRQP